jgi:hypothetical protein
MYSTNTRPPRQSVFVISFAHFLWQCAQKKVLRAACTIRRIGRPHTEHAWPARS